MPIRDLFVRDLGRKIEGVVKVYDRAALAQEIREFVLTDWTEEKLKQFLDTFAESLDARRKRAQTLDDMGVWISGFFGSGKSHFAKLLGYLLQNDVADPATGERAIDLFEAHLHDGRNARDVRRRLGEIRLGTRVTTVFPRQGHYARDPEAIKSNPPADVTVERIGDLVSYELSGLLAASAARPSART